MSETPIKRNVSPAPELCTGCGLCADLCPTQAIKITWSNEGFLIPTINREQCINCGKCLNKCIALEQTTKKQDGKPMRVCAGWSKDSDSLKASSSGGIFAALAKMILKQGGCVFGVAWKDTLNAHFIKAENEQELLPLLGSKYVQAHTQGIYKSVKRELESGRAVLFSGTPCQVHALRTFLTKEYANLFTVDIVCHGVPSHLLIEKYYEYCNKGESTLVNIHFRSKTRGWQSYHVQRTYENGKKSLHPIYEDPYMRMFLSDRILNKSCYKCQYLSHPREGDITLGDFWGVEKYHSDWPIENGISAILANSPKGISLLDMLSMSLNLYDEPYKHLIPHQGGFQRHLELPKDRSNILKRLQQEALEKTIVYTCDWVKIGPFMKINRQWRIYKWLRQLKRWLKK